MFTGTVNFDFRKFEKCAFFNFQMPTAHFQKLMFTGTVNFRQNLPETFENAHFLKNAPPIFKS